MHRSHFAGCALTIVIALGFVAFTGGSAGGLGVLVAALACPIAMIVAMKFLMGGQHANCAHAHQPADRASAPSAEAERA